LDILFKREANIPAETLNSGGAPTISTYPEPSLAFLRGALYVKNKHLGPSAVKKLAIRFSFSLDLSTSYTKRLDFERIHR